MKKKLLILFLFLMFPFSVLADGIDFFHIDATLKNNGDLEVNEVISLQGQYNGFERIIRVENTDAPTFKGDYESLKGSSIYNPDRLFLLSVGENNEYEEVSSGFASRGMSNIYTIDGPSIMIYNPSHTGRDFYLSYLLENLAIVHNDVAEIGWQIFSDELIEDVAELKITINFENEPDMLRTWAHGRVDGNIEVLENKVIITAENVRRGSPIDVRVVFDKDVVENSAKTSNMDALDDIMEIERIWAEERNREIRNERIKEGVSKVAIVLASISTFPLIYVVYKKYDKEYESGFKTDYYRDFPKPYGPEIVEYLIDKKVTSKGMSAALMNLIAEKLVTFEEIGKKSFKLKFVGNKNDLKRSDKVLVELFFEDISKEEVTIEQINKYAKKKAKDFYDKFNIWKEEVEGEALEYKFYYESDAHLKYLIHSFVLLGTFVLALTLELYFVYAIVPLVLGIIYSVYVATIKKRTKEGNEDYAKWKGLKKFIDDFGNFSERDLPKVVLWEKYLVYALIFGSAKKLAKTMAIKVKDMPDATMQANAFNAYYFNRVLLVNNSVSTGISKAHSTAFSTMASASGTGGGFSSGGGSFGGGGGGGRF